MWLLTKGVAEDFCCTLTRQTDARSCTGASQRLPRSSIVKLGLAGQLQIGERNDLQH